MEIKQLKGGVVIAPQLAVEPKKKLMRLGSPGTLFCDRETGNLLTDCAKEIYGIPVVTHVRVIFREVQGTIYLVVAPAWVDVTAEGTVTPVKQEDGKLPGEIYALRHAPQHPTVYKLARLVEALKQPLRRDFWYVMEGQVVKDEQLGLSVAGNFTNAALEPREMRRRKSKPAGGSQPGGPKAS